MGGIEYANSRVTLGTPDDSARRCPGGVPRYEGSRRSGARPGVRGSQRSKQSHSPRACRCADSRSSGPAVPPTVVVSQPATREALLEERVRQLESMVNRLSSQMQGMSAPPGPGGVGPPSVGGGVVLPNIAPGATAPSNIPTPATTIAPSRTGGVGAPGQSLPPNPPPTNRFNSPATLPSLRGNFRFGPGFELRSDDDEYIFQFHDLTQFDYRGYTQGGSVPGPRHVRLSPAMVDVQWPGHEALRLLRRVPERG